MVIDQKLQLWSFGECLCLSSVHREKKKKEHWGKSNLEKMWGSQAGPCSFYTYKGFSGFCFVAFLFFFIKFYFLLLICGCELVVSLHECVFGRQGHQRGWDVCHFSCPFNSQMLVLIWRELNHVLAMQRDRRKLWCICKHPSLHPSAPGRWMLGYWVILTTGDNGFNPRGQARNQDYVL